MEFEREKIMNKSLRKVVIAGNWKMNKTVSGAQILIDELKARVSQANCDVVLCVPYVDIPKAVELCRDTNIKIGAQNVHFEQSGAFTGEISAEMLKELAVSHVIVGHSERRQYFGETDETVALRTAAAVKAGLITIVCVGETLSQRETGITQELVALQTRSALREISQEELQNIIIAYEPIWAIGTGVTATAQQAEEVCGFIRSVLSKLYGDKAADGVTIQYGGSMNAKNAGELLGMENIDGGLIGGASLKAEDFGAITDAGSR